MNLPSKYYELKVGHIQPNDEPFVQEPEKETREKVQFSIFRRLSHFRLRLLIGGFVILFFVKFNLDCFQIPSYDIIFGDPSRTHRMSGFSEPSLRRPTSDVYPAASAESTTLAPFTFEPLSVGSIKPHGWLRDQMILMADGLAGHEYDFYSIVHDSPWLGGSSEYSTLNEGFPYWFNGLVPLAYGLDDSRLISQVTKAVNYVVIHQQADGWLGPETDLNSRDLWGRFPLFLGLIQLLEAEPSMESKLIPPMFKFVSLMHSMLKERKGLGEIWGRARYADMIISLQWLYEKHPQGKHDLLLECMHLLRGQGLDWAGYYEPREFIFDDLDTVELTVTEASFGFVHAVNSGQGLKTGAVDYRFTQNFTLLQSTRNGVEWTMGYHGAASGTIIGDEREAGQSPNRGSELCTAVETMYSLSYLYQMIGDNSFADRCELAAFNALPVMITPDNWAHQYIALPNQPWSRQVESSGLWWNVGDYGITYGLGLGILPSLFYLLANQTQAPNFPCCTVNFPQGYPKYLAASFVKVGQAGLGHALLGPVNVSTTLPNGAVVKIDCETNYPFANRLSYKINTTRPFSLYVRIPQWNMDSAIESTLNGEAVNAANPDPQTGMISLSIPKGFHSVSLKLQPKVRIEPRANSTISVYHGALLYALDVGYSVQLLPPNVSISQQRNSMHTHTGNLPNQSHNYLITNTRPWNIAIDPSTLMFHTTTSNTTDKDPVLPNPIWAQEAPPTWLTAKGCQIGWLVEHGVPSLVPLPGNRTCVGEVEEVILRPYGSLKVHMAELPTINLNSTSRR